MDGPGRARLARGRHRIRARSGDRDIRGKEVLCYYGDGAFGMTAFDMETANRFGVPYLAVIGNNSAMNQIRYGQLAKYGDERGNVGNLLSDVPFSKFAEMLGGYGEEVRDPAQIAGALQRARESIHRTTAARAVVNIWVDPPRRTRRARKNQSNVQAYIRHTLVETRHGQSHSTACAFSISRMCNRARPARNCWRGSART